jgi:hypothetical protein
MEDQVIFDIIAEDGPGQPPLLTLTLPAHLFRQGTSGVEKELQASTILSLPPSRVRCVGADTYNGEKHTPTRSIFIKWARVAYRYGIGRIL